MACGERRRSGLTSLCVQADPTVRPLNDTCIGGSFCAYQTRNDMRMASDAGVAWQSTAAFLGPMQEWQKRTLRPAPFDGTVGCGGRAGGAEAQGCELRLQMATPALRFVVVWY